MLSEINQMEKDKFPMVSLICGISKTNNQNKINEQTKPNQNKHIDIENRIVVPRRERVGVGKMEVIKCMFNMETKILGVSML